MATVESKARVVMTPGKMLREIRLLQGLSVQNLVGLTGYSPSSIRHFEDGRLAMTDHIALRFGQVLNVDPSVLLDQKSEASNDDVNHPSHYTSHPSGVECITITEHHNFNVGNAIKYLWRAGLKDGVPVKDLQKAVWYIQREMKRLEKKSLPR
jgi:transcriptional regulator with XRE-family HTH domain